MTNQASAGRPTILVIDDSPEILMLFRQSLASNFTVHTALTPSEGLKLAINNSPDLIFLDVLMPGTHGFDVFKQLKAIKALKITPVIFISGLGDADDVVQGLAIGAVDYLVKPFNVNILRQRIFNLLEREQLRKEVEFHRDHLEERVIERIREVVEAKAAAEMANHTKSLFLAKMSDELRRPMSDIIGLTDLLLRGMSNQEQVDQLGTVKNSARHLLKLIDDLLDISRIETDRLLIERHPFHFGSIVEKVTRQLSPAAQKKGIALRSDLLPDFAGLTLEGDAERLEQMLFNLTDNAIKYSAQGTVVIRIAAIEKGLDDLLVRMEVIDNGIGLSEADQQIVFEDFKQANSESSGIGLGLALCKRLSSLMGGTVGLSSTLGVGSTFWITVRLPYSQQSVGITALPRPTESSALSCLKERHGSCRLLVAVESSVTREVMTWILRDAGINFDVASDKLLAREMLAQTRYDIALIDLMSSDARDHETVRSMRAVRGQKNLTIIAIMEESVDGYRTKCEQLGINDLISKPIEVTQLFETLLTWLDNHKSGQALNEQRFQMLADIAKELEGEVIFPIYIDLSIRIKQLLRNEEAGSFKSLLKAISLEPLITCKLLQLANTPTEADAPPGEIRDLKTAVRHLGEDTVRTTVAQIVNCQLMLSKGMTQSDQIAKSFWTHSLYTAAAARVLSQQLTQLNADECLLAGWVHDLGAFYMIYRAAQYSELRMRPETVTHLVSQWHESIGLTVLNTLKVPESVIESVIEVDLWRPTPKRLERLSDVVYVANLLAGEEDGLFALERDKAANVELEGYRLLYPDIKAEVKRMREILDC